MMKSNERTALARTPVIKTFYSYSPCNQHIEQIMVMYEMNVILYLRRLEQQRVATL